MPVGRKKLFDEDLASGLYVRLPDSQDKIVRAMAKAEARDIGAVLRRLIKRGLEDEGQLEPEEPVVVKRRAVGGR
jgi:hypothetical protein